ncbi:hypothetical protein F5X68DRAFT_258210 [Plectosphaerella plurivora]|uniref:Zn(2)-C6 fungal-type domain-containing protein n=1 Tax=Plectosphaerella plurivora TaxID=936078 RepID=A0A9P9ACP9_9PEZI|nr:hypothetical protein F5X68DRAFT_258210 [Plectosphaerella plurivora]
MNSPSTLAPTPERPPLGSAKGKRVSRACVSCRVRKTRCDLDAVGSSGRPPCQRCVRQDLECVLAPSRRGGRRVRKSAKLPRAGDAESSGLGGLSVAAAGTPAGRAQRHESNPTTAAGRELVQATPSRIDTRDDLDWEQQSEWASESPPPPQPTGDRQRFNHVNPPGIEGHMASADLLNPSDALNLLAQVADLDTDGRGGDLVAGPDTRSAARPSADVQNALEDPRSNNYPPLMEGLTVADLAALIHNYHTHYHAYFPVAPKAIFDDINPLLLVRTEPHLLTAILIVASKDEKCWSDAHQIFSRYMETLISKLVYGSTATVGAVEALLILAEWATQRPQENPAIGRGEEDHSAWMLVGVAIRLGYLQRLEQTALPHSQPDGSRRLEEYSRRRLAWTACYMSDRQLSTRLGKGFWARGPPPSTMKNIADFPTLQAQKLGSENLALLFQANLELTQLFGNTHDILYSSTSHREQLYMGGEYIRYIDDFTSVLRNWKLEWGSLSFTPHVKASLVLSFDFLRLYINAFAFQATLNRAAAKSARSAAQPSQEAGARSRTGIGSPSFHGLPGNPDARFIYESIDAANSLLGTFNGFIDPVGGLKYMPLKYYLYVIYAAVFLFKARFAGAIGKEAGAGVRRAVHATISRLQKTSHNPHSLGHRYARSLRLLWWKSPERVDKTRHDDTSRVNGGSGSNNLPDHGMSHDPLMSGDHGMPVLGAETHGEGFSMAGSALEPLNGLSWRDLDSLGQFIANHTTTSLTDGTMTSPEFDQYGSSGGMEAGGEEYYYDNFWQGNDIIF